MQLFSIIQGKVRYEEDSSWKHKSTSSTSVSFRPPLVDPGSCRHGKWSWNGKTCCSCTPKSWVTSAGFHTTWTIRSQASTIFLQLLYMSCPNFVAFPQKIPSCISIQDIIKADTDIKLWLLSLFIVHNLTISIWSQSIHICCEKSHSFCSTRARGIHRNCIF